MDRTVRPSLAFYTEKAAMFEVAQRGNVSRALAELESNRFRHMVQTKGPIERFFETAQDRLVKHLRIAGVCTTADANAYLEAEFLPDWQQRFAVAAVNETDAHPPVTELHDLAASFSHMETRRVTNDYTIQFQGKRYQIAASSITARMKGQNVRVELRLTGDIAVRLKGQYLGIVAAMSKVPAQPEPVASRNCGRLSPIPTAAAEKKIRNAGQTQPGGPRIYVQGLCSRTHRRDGKMKKHSDRHRRALPTTYGAVRRKKRRPSPKRVPMATVEKVLQQGVSL
ncbi:MAG TPA: hypothetical protein VER03_12390 [Bryobacteraceae bacterium]|nr:hypothetical protein [Bryobacteraceae bacterium]